MDEFQKKLTELLAALLHAIFWGFCIGIGFWCARKLTDKVDNKLIEMQATKDCEKEFHKLVRGGLEQTLVK